MGDRRRDLPVREGREHAGHGLDESSRLCHEAFAAEDDRRVAKERSRAVVASACRMSRSRGRERIVLVGGIVPGGMGFWSESAASARATTARASIASRELRASLAMSSRFVLAPRALGRLGAPTAPSARTSPSARWRWRCSRKSTSPSSSASAPGPPAWSAARASSGEGDPSEECLGHRHATCPSILHPKRRFRKPLRTLWITSTPSTIPPQAIPPCRSADSAPRRHSSAPDFLSSHRRPKERPRKVLWEEKARTRPPRDAAITLHPLRHRPPYSVSP